MTDDQAANDLKCDLLIFVATPSEVEQLETVAKEMAIEFRETKARDFAFYSMGTIGSNRVNAVRVEMGPFSYGGSAARGIFYKTVSSAAGIIQLGMAFGVNDNQQKLGDVLISTHLFPYDYRQIDESDGWYKTSYSKVVPHPAKQSLLEMCRKHHESTSLGHEVYFGGLLTGGAKIFSKHFVREMQETLPKVEEGLIVGGEMEGAGLLSITPKDDPCWLVVKGICDFADENRDRVIRESRPVACRNSARFVLSALSKYPQL